MIEGKIKSVGSTIVIEGSGLSIAKTNFLRISNGEEPKVGEVWVVHSSYAYRVD